jgi:lipoate-protein ligase A
LNRRGEFKTPGGKLIAVEFTVVDGALRGVVVTGDFFLYPEEALPRLAESLEGTPDTSTELELAERVERALSANTELVGSSPRALAVAVRRALDVPIGN